MRICDAVQTAPGQITTPGGSFSKNCCRLPTQSAISLSRKNPCFGLKLFNCHTGGRCASGIPCFSICSKAKPALASLAYCLARFRRTTFSFFSSVCSPTCCTSICTPPGGTRAKTHSFVHCWHQVHFAMYVVLPKWLEVLKGAWIWPLSASHFTAEERRGPSAATMAHGCQAFRFLPRWDIEPEPLARSNSKNNKLRLFTSLKSN